jgi:prepilin-type N-terminal cleavage/methylation domain-containing protein
MRHYNAHHYEDGFTFLELIIVTIFIGILAAIAAPSFLTWNQRYEVINSLNNAKGALLEAQRGAIRTGKSCALSLSTSTRPTISVSSNNNCLDGGTRTLDKVSMQISTNNTTLSSSTASLTFDYLGNVTAPTNTTTIVLTHSSNSNLKRCLVISTPLGLIASGKYSGTSTTDISSNCVP